MNMKFRQCELVFTLDENMEVDVNPIGENKYVVTFVTNNIQKKTALTPEHITQPIFETQETLETNEITDFKTQKNTPTEDSKPNSIDALMVDNVVKYFKSFDDITLHTFNNPELSEHFYGKKIDSKKENLLYQKFRGIINKAKDIFATEENGHWEETEERAYLGNNVRPKAFRFVRNKTKNN